MNECNFNASVPALGTLLVQPVADFNIRRDEKLTAAVGVWESDSDVVAIVYGGEFDSESSGEFAVLKVRKSVRPDTLCNMEL